MSLPITVAAFSTITDAEAAVRQLIGVGLSADKISVLGKDMQCEKQVHGFVTSCDVAKKVATGGAWLGGLFRVAGGVFAPMLAFLPWMCSYPKQSVCPQERIYPAPSPRRFVVYCETI